MLRAFVSEYMPYLLLLLMLVLFSCGSDEQAVCPDQPVPLVESMLDPGADGAYPVCHQMLTLELSEKSLIVELFLPRIEAGTDSALVFNHGFGSNAEQYRSYGQRLASHGVLTLIPTYDDGFSDPATHVELLEYLQEIVAWLRERSAEELRHDIRADRVMVAGHSRGGKQAIHAALLDSSLSGAFVLDPVDAPPPFGDVDPEEFPKPCARVNGSAQRSLGNRWGRACLERRVRVQLCSARQ